MSSEEETFRRLMVELRILEGTAEALQSRMSLVNAALTELRIAGMTLEGLEKEKEDAQLFVPVGGGSYIKAKLENADKVVVGIGANVAIEMAISEAKENVGTRIDDLEKTMTSLQQQFNQVVMKIQDGRAMLGELTAKISEKERANDVRETEERD